MKKTISPLNKMSSKQYWKYYVTPRCETITYTVSSGSSGCSGNAKYVGERIIRATCTNASDNSVVCKFTAPTKLEITDWEIFTRSAGSGPIVSLTGANTPIAAIKLASTASGIRTPENSVGQPGWDTDDTIVNSGSTIRLAFLQSHVHSTIHMISFRPVQ